MSKFQDGTRDLETPDLVVNASIFGGLLAFFAALVAVFAVISKPATNTEFASAERDATERRYFGSFTEVAMIYPDSVQFFADAHNSFSVTSKDLPQNRAVLDYLAQIAASQRTDKSDARRLLFAMQPGSTNNMFWLETMAGDTGVQSISFMWFNQECAHIDGRGTKGTKMMEECLDIRR